nr:hypothetical protein [Tanacetum cinerariifolium]
SPRVPVSFLEDPYKAIRQVYLVETDTESEPFEDPVATEIPESPHTVRSPTLLPDSTPLTRQLRSKRILTRPVTARMAVRVPLAMSHGLSANIAERSWGTSELVEDDEKEDDEEEDEEEDEDEKVDESSDSDSESEDAKDEGSAAGDEGLAAKGEGPGQGYGSIPEPERPKRVSALRQPTITTWIDPKDGRVYIDVPTYLPPAPPIQTPLSPEWLSASPAMAEAEGFLTDLGAQVEMQEGLINDYTIRLGELSPALFEKYDRDIGELFTRAFWRPLLALESLAGQTDAERAALWHAISDTQIENQ